MGRKYTAVKQGVSVSAAQDFFELQSPADAVTKLTAVRITNASSETSEQLEFRMKRGEGSVTSGSGGSTVTPAPTSKGDAAFGGTVEVNNTTKLAVGSGAIKEIHSEGFNLVGSALDWRGEVEVSPSDYIAGELVGAPAAAFTCDITIEFEETGG